MNACRAARPSTTQTCCVRSAKRSSGDIATPTAASTSWPPRRRWLRGSTRQPLSSSRPRMNSSARTADRSRSRSTRTWPGGRVASATMRSERRSSSPIHRSNALSSFRSMCWARRKTSPRRSSTVTYRPGPCACSVRCGVWVLKRSLAFSSTPSAGTPLHAPIRNGSGSSKRTCRRSSHACSRRASRSETVS